MPNDLSTGGRSIWAGVDPASAQVDDAELVAAARRDRTRFTSLYERYADHLFRYARARTGSAADADEIVSQTMLAALEQLQRFDPAGGSFASWLFAIARRRISDGDPGGSHMRRLVTRLRRPDPLGDDAFDVLTRTDDAQRVRSLLARLSDRERDLLLLRYGAGLHSSEIGDALGISARTALARLSRILARLAEEMREEEGR